MAEEGYGNYNWDAENFHGENADYANTNYGDTSGGAGGGSTGMTSNSPTGGGSFIAGYIAKGIGGSTGVYGSWYEGEQQNAYYWQQVALTWQEKEKAVRSIEMEERQAAFMLMQSDYAQQDVGFAKQKRDIVLKDYQDKTDEWISTGYSKGAKAGVDMSFGSPLDVLAEQSDKRAYGYAVTKWQGDTDVWQKERDAQGIREKATIMLDNTKVARANLGQYDYQAALYTQAAGEARRAARYKGYGIATSAV